MKVIIFTSIVCSIFVPITATCTSSSCGSLSVKYPSQRSVLQNGSVPFRSLQLPLRRYPTPPSVFRSEQPKRSNAIEDDIRSRLPKSASASVLSSTNESPPSKRDAGRTGQRKKGGTCTRQKSTPSNLVPNQPGRVVRRVQVPITMNESSNIPLDVPVGYKSSGSNNSGKNSVPEADQPSNPKAIHSINPLPTQTDSKEANKSSKKEMESEKKPEPAIPESSSSKAPKKEEDEDEWEGPKTLAEDKPELYTTDENVKTVREFTSDMTLEGKYKIGEIIYYLLTKKEKELDTADKAAIEYVVKQRMQKDPELTAEYKKYNEKHKDGNNKSIPSTNNQGNSDEDMPPYMRQLLSPSFSISQFETPSPTENSTNLPSQSDNEQDFLSSILLIIGHRPPPFFNPGIQNRFYPDSNGRDTNPFSGNRPMFVGNGRFLPPPQLPPAHPQYPPSLPPPRFRSAFPPPSRRWEFP